MGWRDRQDSEVLAGEPGAKYPWVQWVNRGADLDPRRQAGGFFITSENLAVLGDPEIKGGESSGVVFSGGDTDTGIFLPEISVAVMGSRFRWQIREGNRTRGLSEWVQGARSKLQVLILLQTAQTGWVGPLMITLTGTVTGDFWEAYKEHRQEVRKATGGRGAAAWFWMTLTAGEPVQRGDQGASSLVTPIALVAPESFDPDALYVGDGAADFIEKYYPTVETWRDEWGEQEDLSEDASPTVAADPVPESDHGRGSYGPMGEARNAFSEQWSRLKKLGVTAPLLHNDWKAMQIKVASGLLKAAANDLEGGKARDLVAADLIAALEGV